MAKLTVYLLPFPTREDQKERERERHGQKGKGVGAEKDRDLQTGRHWGKEVYDTTIIEGKGTEKEREKQTDRETGKGKTIYDTKGKEMGLVTKAFELYIMFIL